MKHNRRELLAYALKNYFVKAGVMTRAKQAGVCLNCMDEGIVEEMRCRDNSENCCGGCYVPVKCRECNW